MNAPYGFRFFIRSKRSISSSRVRWQSSLFSDPLPPAGSGEGVGGLFNLSSPYPPDIQASTDINKPFVGIPTRHSRKRLPSVVTDVLELTELATEFIDCDIGRLFTYNEYAIDKKEAMSRTAAWDVSDVTVQKVESVIRGFSYLVPGTMWNRWLTEQKSTIHTLGASSATTVETKKVIDDIPPSDLLILQQQLVDRMIDEGHAYMTIRNVRMEDMFGKKGSAPITGSIDALGNRVVQKNETIEEKMEAALAQEMLEDKDDDDDDEIEKEDSYMYDFAAPGPTTAMYDTMLDTMACTAAFINNRAEALMLARHFHETIMIRHTNDGGDTKNDNIHTLPTAVSFNALIRIAAELPYDNTVNISAETSPIEEVEYRDDVCATFITTVQLMHECGAVYRNSATYKYALDCVAKYMPPSRIRGNVSTGLFQQARYAGLINDSVIASYIKANTPSNDEWNDNYIRDVLQPGTWPTKWKKESRIRQFHPREDVY